MLLYNYNYSLIKQSRYYNECGEHGDKNMTGCLPAFGLIVLPAPHHKQGTLEHQHSHNQRAILICTIAGDGNQHPDQETPSARELNIRQSDRVGVLRCKREVGTATQIA